MTGADPRADAEEVLCEELRLFCKDNGLPFLSASDLRHQTLDASQLSWLESFIERWDAVVDSVER